MKEHPTINLLNEGVWNQVFQNIPTLQTKSTFLKLASLSKSSKRKFSNFTGLAKGKVCWELSFDNKSKLPIETNSIHDAITDLVVRIANNFDSKLHDFVFSSLYKFKNLKSLTIYNNCQKFEVVDQDEGFMMMMNQLEELTVLRGNLDFLNFFMKKCSNLKHLVLLDFQPTTQAVQIPSISKFNQTSITSLSSVVLEDYQALTVLLMMSPSIRLKNLVLTHVSETSELVFWQKASIFFSKHGSELESLTLKRFNYFKTFAQSCFCLLPQLKALKWHQISEGDKIKDEDFEILKNIRAKKMKEISIFGNLEELKGEFLREMRKLRFLELKSNDSDSNLNRNSGFDCSNLINCEKLETLRLARLKITNSLDLVRRSSPNLESLVFQSCSGIDSERLKQSFENKCCYFLARNCK